MNYAATSNSLAPEEAHTLGRRALDEVNRPFAPASS